MMPPENREAMHRGLEASLGCLQPKGFLYGSPCPRGYKSINNGVNGVKLANVESDNDGALSYDLLAIPSESCGRPVQQDSYYVWPALSPNYMKDLHIQSYLLDSCFYPGHYFGVHWIPQIPFHIAPQFSSSDYVLQDFQYFVVIDFEATCDKEKNPHPQEIIEFPSVLVNSRTGQLEGCFQIYVRPSHNKLLSEFCKDLTGIQQSQVDKGVLLSDALLMHDKWLEDKGIKHTNFAVVTWSNWDCKVMLESECRFKRIRKPPYFNRWINLKIPFNKLYGDGRRNLKEAVELAGLTWEGRAHCGLDDAKNTAHLVTHLMHLGYKLAITNSLMWQSADHPSAVHRQQQIPAPENNLTYQPQKWKPLNHFVTAIPFPSLQASNPMQEPIVYCLCGATSVKQVFHKPGPKHGCSFFGCGNWTAHRGPACSFFKWVPDSDSAKPV